MLYRNNIEIIFSFEYRILDTNNFEELLMSELVIRPITKDDIPSCLDIYNYEVVNGVATLDLEPRTLTEWQEWYEAHQTSEHCIL